MSTPRDQIIDIELIAASADYAQRAKPLYTLKIRYPRMVHADFMTHRVFSRNASSSRAMPSVTLLKDEPYVPQFRSNKPGMQPGDYLDADAQQEAEKVWLEAVESCRKAASILAEKSGLNVHKQWANRMLEWFGYITVVVTSVDFDNYLGLRDHGDAQDEIQFQAEAVRKVIQAAEPKILRPDDWHLPFIQPEDIEEIERLLFKKHETDVIELSQISFAFVNLPHVIPRDRLLLARSTSRCARTSYRNFDGKKATLQKDIETFLKLGSEPIHASPFEHQARPRAFYDYDDALSGNLPGWQQFRKFIPNERILHG